MQIAAIFLLLFACFHVFFALARNLVIDFGFNYAETETHLYYFIGTIIAPSTGGEAALKRITVKIDGQYFSAFDHGRDLHFADEYPFEGYPSAPDDLMTLIPDEGHWYADDWIETAEEMQQSNEIAAVPAEEFLIFEAASINLLSAVRQAMPPDKEWKMAFGRNAHTDYAPSSAWLWIDVLMVPIPADNFLEEPENKIRGVGRAFCTISGPGQASWVLKETHIPLHVKVRWQ